MFCRSFPSIDFVVRQDPPSDVLKGADIDVQIAAGDLGKYLRADGSSFPGGAHYLVPDADKQASIRSEYQQRWPNKQLVGVSWHSGNKTAGARRSITLQQLSPVLSCDGCQFINLQYGDVADELLAYGQATGINIFDDPDVDPLTDIDVFTAQVAALDQVVTIDNSTAHISGALGVPTRVLLPYSTNWRWSLERSDSLWYSSVGVYRQPAPTDWQPIVEQVREDLKRPMMANV